MPKQPSAAQINRVVRKLRKWPKYAGYTEEKLRVAAEAAVQLSRALACGEVLHRAPTPEELQEFAANRAEQEHREYREYQDLLSKDLAREGEEEPLSEDEWKQKRERERQVEKENELLENELEPLEHREVVEGVLETTKREELAGPEGPRLMRVAERRRKRLARAATGGKRGRPRATDDEKWLDRYVPIARQRFGDNPQTLLVLSCQGGRTRGKKGEESLRQQLEKLEVAVFDKCLTLGARETEDPAGNLAVDNLDDMPADGNGRRIGILHCKAVQEVLSDRFGFQFPQDIRVIVNICNHVAASFKKLQGWAKDMFHQAHLKAERERKKRERDAAKQEARRQKQPPQ